MERKHIVWLAVAGVLLAAGATAGVFWLGPERLLSQPAALTGDITKATESPGEHQPTPAEADEPQEPYEPTSEYIEPGLDPEVTTFAMERGDHEVDENLPEMLSDAAIQRVMNQRQQELVQCYADGLQQDPELSGRVFFHFRIAPDGHVAMVQVTGSKLRSKTTEDCFVQKARHWTFPATRREVLTRFDTNFNFVTQ